MKSRDLKSQLRLKQKLITRGDGYPGNAEGRDGEITIRNVQGRGIFIFYKWGNKWYSTRMSTFTPRNSEKQEAVILPKGRKPRVAGEMSIHTDGKVYVRGSDKRNKQILRKNTSTGVVDTAKAIMLRADTADMSDTEAQSPNWLFENTGHSHLHLHCNTTSSAFDPFIVFSSLHPETFSLKRWIMGFDVSAVEFVWGFRSGVNASSDKRYVPDTPSATSYQKMTLDQLGNLTTTGTITSSAGELSPGDITSVSLTGDSGSVLNDTGPTADFIIAGGTNCSTSGGASQTMTINVDTPAVTSIDGAIENELVTIGSTTTELVSESTLTFDGETLLSKSVTSSKPELILKNTTIDATSPILNFTTQRGAIVVDAVDDDVLGTVSFNGYDDGTPSTQLYSRIKVSAEDVSSGAEKGKFSIDVASNNGAITSAATFIGTSTAFQVDTTLGGTLKLKETADASTDSAVYGQVWVDNTDPNILMYTDGDGQDIHLVKNTAVWGGGFARTTGANGIWLGIPTGHMGANLSFGTTITAPDTSLNVTLTADDLCGVIWQSIHGIRVTNCRIWYAQGGGTNTRHSVCLMRYDIDADGTLSNGVEVAGVDDDGGSDDYTTLAFMDLTMTSDDTLTNAQVLIAMVYFKDAANAAASAKCILEYQDLP